MTLEEKILWGLRALLGLGFLTFIALGVIRLRRRVTR